MSWLHDWSPLILILLILVARGCISLLLLNLCLLLDRLRWLLVLGLLLPKAFGIQLLGVVFQEHVVLMNSHFDALKVPTLACATIFGWEQLVLCNTSLLQRHDELFAVSDYIIREIGPFQL